jgi:hypothetical protein
VLFAYVGLLIGALAAVRPRTAPHPLAQALHRRVTLLGEAFRQIVAAQFWIALFNTLLTASSCWSSCRCGTCPALHPGADHADLCGRLIPIVGNLLCNVVLTVVGLSVSPIAAAACLAFLILIHKAEYVINAKVIGQRTHMGVWEHCRDVRGRIGVRPRRPGGRAAVLRLPEKELHDARMI